MLDSKRTGLDFNNKLSYNQDFNLFTYIYFYNGSGVGAGDFNNDGLIDLFFGANQGQNKIYLNTGGIRFKDVTTEAAVPQDGGWTTGVSVVDINNDGLLDIYVCRVGNYEILHGKNQLLINQGVNKDGVPVFVDRAKEYGLDFSGFATQAAFIDYDNDGDLDMFLLNHSVHENGTFRPRKDFENTYSELSGDRMYRNDGNVFTDVTRQSGINSSAIGYGLGIAISDVNLDGYPDIYICNDFHENDYLYINQKNGTFKDEGEKSLMHTSRFSMGVDIADANNDAFPEIVSLDMLPADPYILKRSVGDAYDVFKSKIHIGYSYQYTRNNLQFNRGNGMFSETGLYSGIAATDWSWAPLWMDFDNDGLKDLFMSNGIPKRLNDIDYINFISNREILEKIRNNTMQEKDMSLIEKFPEIRLPNKFFRNTGRLSFDDEEAEIGNNEPGFSTGAIYADLDNDGDLDIVVNNIDAPAMVYENKNTDSSGSFLRVKLHGPKTNVNAIGAKIIVYANGEIRTYDKYPVRGFLSSMEIPLQVGLKNTKVDSVLLVWPDHTYERVSGTGEITLNYTTGLPVFDFKRLSRPRLPLTLPVQDITSTAGLSFLHQENDFAEFDREPLIPHMLSTEGPALCVADINHDGLDDIFVGSARNYKSAVFVQQPDGRFIKTIQPILDQDSSNEDVDACWADVNHDGNVDLVVAHGGNEFYGHDAHNTPAIYLNDGKANLTRIEHPFDSLYLTASSVVPYDFNDDGFTDLFIGGRTVPWEYGQVPRSYLLMNDKKGKFIDVTDRVAKGLGSVGLVTQATWYDLDKDGDMDLLLSLEWGSITAFMNDKGIFTKKELSDKKGWWNSVLPCDIDNDGDIDLIAGNLGLNSRLSASSREPVRLYYADFDENGKKEQVFTYYVQGKEIPFANKLELEKQMPFLKKKFLYAEDFAKSGLNEIFDADKLKNAQVLTADYFSNAVLINKGNMQFETHALPWLAQLTSYKDAIHVDANNDSLPDILILGNYYDSNVEMGRYDADFGTLLINKGQGNFECQPVDGLTIKGQVRRIRKINIQGKPAYLLARNNDSLKLIRFSSNVGIEKRIAHTRQ